ncbi:hypothetical protein LZC95_53230 [Pendulispora brunnea]|uniref:Uncharacterized protein n=1 Tax=Pendulispora brunnea TaxID=2905690 RepID=A0ABZ2K903_9BACT
MRLTIKRLLPLVVLPVAFVGLSAIFHHDDHAKDASAANASRIVSVTDDVTDRDAPLTPRNRPDLFVYSARTQGLAETKVFVEHRNGKKELVYIDAEPGELVDVSADGSHGVFRRYITPGKTETYTIDFNNHAS